MIRQNSGKWVDIQLPILKIGLYPSGNLYHDVHLRMFQHENWKYGLVIDSFRLVRVSANDILPPGT